MCLNGLDQIGRPAVVQEEDPLSESPQRRSAELIGSGRPLRDVIRQARAHMVDQQIGEEVRLDVSDGVGRRERGAESRVVAQRAAGADKFPGAVQSREWLW